MNGAQGARSRDDILNICFVEHEHYFFTCLTVCLRNFVNVAEIAKNKADIEKHFLYQYKAYVLWPSCEI